MEYESYSAAATTRSCATNAFHDKEKPNIRRLENYIYFSDRITYQTVLELNFMLHQVESEIMDDVKLAEGDAKKTKAKMIDVVIDPKPIILHITTHGGLIHAAFSVVDTIRSLRVPVHTVVSGYVASAGTLISLAGKRRFITPNSFMMIHEIRSGFWGRYSDVRVEHENLTKLMEHITKYYVDKTRITRERLAEMLRTDTDLNATECLELGLVDVVG
jgi:ATP-dependent Clp endopeptidase proteolytic subunit ClpP